MSQYENYTATSRRYDETRITVGTEIILGCLALGPTPLHQQRVLDAGCGTGNYSAALLPHVGTMEAVDLNEGMLEQARNKLAEQATAGRIGFNRAPIDTLPFDDASFDGITINQVLHHLDLSADDDYPTYRRVFAEFFRVLRPGGRLIINTCSIEQLQNGFWYYRLIPEQRDSMCARHAPLAVMRQLIRDAGMDCLGTDVPIDALMQGEAYFDCRGPLSSAWRDGDSIWATVPAATIEQVVEQVRNLDDKGELEAFMQAADARRPHIGQFSFLCGARPGRPD